MIVYGRRVLGKKAILNIGVGLFGTRNVASRDRGKAMKYVMLSILSDTYEDDKISNLERARESAKVFEDFFTEELPEDQRFTLIRLDNPSASRCSRIFDEIVEKYDADTTLVILWTGHGILSPSGAEHLFLCPEADWTVARGKSEVGAIPDRLVKEKLKNFPGAVVEIQDDCRSDPDNMRNGLAYKVNYVRKQRDNLRRDPVTRPTGSKKKVRRGRRFHLWACDDGQSTGDNAVFANAFVKTAREQLERAGGLVMNDSFVEELCENANLDDQTPVSGGAPIVLVGDLPDNLGGDEPKAKKTDASQLPLAVSAVVVVAIVASLFAYLNSGARVIETEKPSVQTPTISETETVSASAAPPGDDSVVAADSETSVAATPVEDRSETKSGEDPEFPKFEPNDLESDDSKVSSDALVLAKTRASQLAAEGKQLRDDGEIDTSVAKVNAALALDSDCDEALELRTQITSGWLDEAEGKLTAGDYSEAKTLVEKATRFDPTVAPNRAATLSSQIAKDEKASGLVADGEKAFDGKRYDDALTKATAALAENPSDAVATKANALKTRATKASDDAKVAGELQDGWTALGGGKISDAEKVATGILKNDPENAGAKELLARVRTKEGEALFSDGKLDEAASKVRETLALDANCREAADLKGKIRNSWVADADNELNARSYAKAKALAEKTLDLVPNDPRATYLLNQADVGLKEEERVLALVKEGEKTLADARAGKSLEKARDALKQAKDALTANPTGEVAARAKTLETDANCLILELETATLVKEGWDALNAGDVALAKSKAREALQKDAENDGAKELQSAAKKANAKRLAKEGETSRLNGKLDDADSKMKEALADDPNCKEAKDLQSRIAEDRKNNEDDRQNQEKIAKLLKEGRDALNNGYYSLAKSKANAAGKLRPNDPEVKKLADDAAALETKKMEEDSKKVATTTVGTSSGGSTTSGGTTAGGSTSSWGASSNRKAGYRQTLKIGNAEYGFCWIPSGVFNMGAPMSENGRRDDEKLHHVRLTKGFWMLESETPQALYREVVGTNPSYFKGDNLPVESVSWNDAMKFCTELTKRLPKGLKASLPTEAQWEYSCRAGSLTAFSFGSALNRDKANCIGYGTTTKLSPAQTEPVKSYDPNKWGLYDMHGNVLEWCLDYYGDYPSGTVTDPRGSNNASFRVIRGGGYRDDPIYCRSACRAWIESFAEGGDIIGFRFLLTCDESSNQAEESVNKDSVGEVENSNRAEETANARQSVDDDSDALFAKAKKAIQERDQGNLMSASEINAKIHSQQVKKLIGDVITDARKLAKTDPDGALQNIKSAINSVKNDRLISDADRDFLLSDLAAQYQIILEEKERRQR